jgi:hypothetical protein
MRVVKAQAFVSVDLKYFAKLKNQVFVLCVSPVLFWRLLFLCFLL